MGLPQFAGSATISGVLPGLYYGVVTDANGCRDTVAVQIPYRSYVDAAVQPVDIAGCVPLAVSWVALPSGVGPYTYQWDLGDGSTATDSVVVHVYPLQGSYPVTLIIRNGDGCADTATAIAQAYLHAAAYLYDRAGYDGWAGGGDGLYADQYRAECARGVVASGGLWAGGRAGAPSEV